MNLIFAIVMTCSACPSTTQLNYGQPVLTTEGHIRSTNAVWYGNAVEKPFVPGCTYAIKPIPEDDVQKNLDAGNRVFKVYMPFCLPNFGEPCTDGHKLSEVKRVEKPRVFEVVEESVQ